MVMAEAAEAVSTVSDFGDSDTAKDYKQTEVGVIPQDWELIVLGDSYDFQNGVNAEGKAYGSGVRFANVLEVITNSHLRSDQIPGRVRLTQDRIREFCVHKGDILFNRTSETQDEVGLTSVYIDDEDIVFGGFVVRARPKRSIYDQVYIGYALRADFIRSQIIARGQGAVRANIGQSELKTIRVPKPSSQEQEAIANALSDADALTESLEQIIAKKRQIKHGAMHELLQPKAAWETKRLGNTAVLKARIGWQGLTTSEYLESGDYFLVTGTEFSNGLIDWESCYFVSEARFRQDKNIQLRQKDVLVTKDGTIGKVAIIKQLDKPATLNSGVFVIRPINRSFDPEFFYYLLYSDVFSDFLRRLSAGSTITHLYQKDFVNFTYKTPPTVEEQANIAATLNDMDDEITALEAKLAKARQIKHGMMQELLTGRVRLI